MSLCEVKCMQAVCQQTGLLHQQLFAVGPAPIRVGASAKIPTPFVIVDLAFPHPVQGEADVIEIISVLCRLITTKQKVVGFRMDKFLAAAGVSEEASPVVFPADRISSFFSW